MNNIPQEIIRAYSEPHRRFHTEDHILNMLIYCELEREGNNPELWHAILWHDFIYDPKADPGENELSSARAWMKYSDPDYNSYYTESNIDRKRVADLILATATPFKDYSNDKDKELITKADFDIFNKGVKELIKYEQDIFYEFQQYPLKKYKKGRIRFLKNLLKHFTENSIPYENILYLINYISNKKYKIGVFPGSFNPFHIGHKNIIEQAENIFDKVIIAQGYNTEKEKPVRLNNTIQEVYTYSGLLSYQFSNTDDITYTIIRGLRDAEDLKYESNFKQTLKDLENIHQITYFLTPPELRHISSKMIRSLYPFGKDIYGKYLA